MIVIYGKAYIPECRNITEISLVALDIIALEYAGNASMPFIMQVINQLVTAAIIIIEDKQCVIQISVIAVEEN